MEDDKSVQVKTLSGKILFLAPRKFPLFCKDEEY